MGNLYENIINRSATNREANEKILSAYDKMLMNELAERILEGTELYEASWLDAARKVVKNHQMLYVNKNGKVSEDKKSGYMMLDATTANMLVTIADALKKETSEQFTSMPLDKAVNIGWKLIKK